MTAIVLYKDGPRDQSAMALQLAAADPRLQVLVYFVAGLVVDRGWAPAIVVTSVKRAHVPGTQWSVHEVDPCRGCDLRTRGLLDDATALELEEQVNAVFAYSNDPDHPHRCAWFETVERARKPVTPHIHLQVPPWPGSGTPVVTVYHPSEAIV